MPGRYRAYTEYKPTNTDWLGEAPTHWKTIPVGRLFRRTKRMDHTDKELLSVYRDYGVIPTSSRDDNNNKPSEDLTPYQLVEPNDLVMNKMKAWQGSIAISEYEGIVSPAYFVYQPLPKLFDLAFPKYIHYLLRHPIYIAQYLRQSKGIRVNQWDLDPDAFQRIELLLPEKNEQTKILQFLDHETAKIDTLIEKQQQLIQLLKEKRLALVHEATIGAKVVRLENCTDTISRTISFFVDEIYTPVGLFNRGRGIFHKDPTLGRDLGDSEFFYIKPNDLILSGQFAWEGAVALTDNDDDGCIASHRYPVIRGKEGMLDTSYLWAFFTSQRGDFLLNENSRGAAGRNRPLNLDYLLKEKIPLPTMEAQLSISKIVQHEKIIHQKIKNMIITLEEKRIVLISAIVSGKFDVRDWKAPKESKTNKEIAA